jgi:hypothetical protein
MNGKVTCGMNLRRMRIYYIIRNRMEEQDKTMMD